MMPITCCERCRLVEVEALEAEVAELIIATRENCANGMQLVSKWRELQAARKAAGLLEEAQ